MRQGLSQWPEACQPSRLDWLPGEPQGPSCLSVSGTRIYTRVPCHTALSHGFWERAEILVLADSVVSSGLLTGQLHMFLCGPSFPSLLALSRRLRRGMRRTGRGYVRENLSRKAGELSCSAALQLLWPEKIPRCSWEKISTITQDTMAGPRSWEGELILHIWRYISTHLSSDQTGNCQSPSEMPVVHACPSALSKALASLALVSLHPK